MLNDLGDFLNSKEKNEITNTYNEYVNNSNDRLEMVLSGLESVSVSEF